jgi:alkylation response protein AidB-like acyl-CoA dehydrogenase
MKRGAARHGTARHGTAVVRSCAAARIRKYYYIHNKYDLRDCTTEKPRSSDDLRPQQLLHGAEPPRAHVAGELRMSADSSAISDMPGAGTEMLQPGGQANESEIADRILAAIDALAPGIAARAAEAEAARRLPKDIIQTIKASGAFRMTVPKAKGGFELDFPFVARILQRLTRIDGSVGWLSAVQAIGGMLLASASHEAYEQVYRDGPDVMFAGANRLSGTAEAVQGGWRINGRWPFASGCEDADWIGVNCELTRDGQALPGQVEGTPASSFVLLRARHARIDDTWYSTGLKATGSHHIALHDAMAGENSLLDIFAAQRCVPGPLYCAPMHLLTLVHGTVALGMAEGALDDVVAMARSGRQQQRAATAMQDSEIFRYELGRAQTKLGAAQMAHDALVERHWRHALAGTLNTETKFIEATRFAIWLTETSLDVVQSCFTLGGGAAIFESSPLQRRLRDLEVAAQHAGIHERHYAEAGKRLLSGDN